MGVRHPRSSVRGICIQVMSRTQGLSESHNGCSSMLSSSGACCVCLMILKTFSACGDRDLGGPHCVIYLHDMRHVLQYIKNMQTNLPLKFKGAVCNRWEKIILSLVLSLVFNQMCDDAEFALETPVFCLLPIPHTHIHLSTLP